MICDALVLIQAANLPKYRYWEQVKIIFLQFSNWWPKMNLISRPVFLNALAVNGPQPNCFHTPPPSHPPSFFSLLG